MNDEHPLPLAMDALVRLRRAYERGTGCNLTAEMVRQLALTMLGEIWDEGTIGR